MDQDDLHQLEELCIQEHNPACMATCPARVDVRGICSELQKGNFPAALKLLRKTIPFPGIISRICDQPCRSACIRKDAGEAISIALLEQSCVEHGGSPGAIPFIPKRNYHLGVIGGSLFGLTAACDMAKKGYQVTVFEKRDLIGGAIRFLPRSILPDEIIETDFKFLIDLGVHILVNKPVEEIVQLEDGGFKLNGQLFNAVLIATGSSSDLKTNLDMGKSGVLIDPVSYETSLPGVFSGGRSAECRSLNNHGDSDSPIANVADGHRVTTSIDRFSQNVSLTASRLIEGSYETKLFTSLDGVIPSKANKPNRKSYTKEEAIEEAQRCLKCECLECVKVCEYLNDYGSYPKRYIREIYNNLSIVKGERKKNQFINSCSLCGLCGVVCPTNLDMGKVCLEARKTMVEQGRMPPSAHDFALRDMKFSNSENIALIKNEPGKTNCGYLFFPGCQMTASNPEYVEKIYSLLRELPELAREEGIGLALRCCGAPARWAGRTDLFDQTKAEFLKEYEKLGNPKVIVACSSCYQIFKEEFPQIPLVSLWNLLANTSTPLPFAEKGNESVISIHDPCTTRMESDIQDSVRSLVDKAGYQIEELPLSREKTECCSYGGLMWLANPTLAKKTIERRIGESQNAFVTYCVMCRDFFTKQGKTTYHVLDMLFNPSLLNFEFIPPDFSQRHRNREELKIRMSKKIWGEDMATSRDRSFKLRISQEVRKILEERLILEEDINKVLDHVKKTGLFLENPDNHHNLAYFCPAYVTYWVEFTKSGDEYTIYNAYSHRMTIDEGTKK